MVYLLKMATVSLSCFLLLWIQWLSTIRTIDDDEDEDEDDDEDDDDEI